MATLPHTNAHGGDDPCVLTVDELSDAIVVHLSASGVGETARG